MVSALLGFSAPTDGCACEICRVLRSHADDLETRDTLPPVAASKSADELLADIKAALAGGAW